MPPPPPQPLPLPFPNAGARCNGDREYLSEEQDGVGPDEGMIGEEEEGEGEEVVVHEVEMSVEEEDEDEGREEAVEAGGGEGEGARKDRNTNRDDKFEEPFGRSKFCSSAAGKSEVNSSSNRASVDGNCDFGTAIFSDGPVERFGSVGHDSTSSKLGKCRGPPEDMKDPKFAMDGGGDGVQLQQQRKVPVACGGLYQNHAYFDCVRTTQNLDFSLPNASLTVPDIYAAPCSEKDRQVELQARGGMQISSRCPKMTASRARLRSLSPVSELPDQNKRLAIICDFFARGWCIKGSSCRFLHIKDNVNSTPELVCKLDEGQKDGFEKSILPGLPKQCVSSVAHNSALSSGSCLEQVQSQLVKENQSVHQVHSITVSKPLGVEDFLFSTPTDSHHLPSYKHNNGPLSPEKDKGRDLRESSWSADDCRIHDSKLSSGGSGSMREYWLPPSSGSLRSFNLGQDEQPSSHAFIAEDQAANQGKFVADSSPIASLPLNSRVKCPLTTTILSSQHTSRMTGPSGIFDSFSEVSNPLPAQSILDVDCAGHRSSSLLGSSSNLAGSDPGNLSDANITADSRPLFGNRRALLSYDWEPSEPFRPSFFISATAIPSPGSNCDPFRDSIEQHKAGNESFRLSFSSQGASVLKTAEQWVHGDSKQNIVEEHGNDICLVSSHHKFNEHGLDKGSYLHGKEVNGSAVETTENSVVDSQTENGMSKENDQQSDQANDSSHIAGSSMDLGSALGSDAGHKKDLLSDKVRQDIEMDVMHKKAADMDQESKALRHFRVALINCVKELLKPSWQAGRLSKDVHNLIVRKTVDKVLMTLQPQQIPPNPESIKHFLSYSQLKLTKLVEAYVDKHAKD